MGRQELSPGTACLRLPHESPLIGVPYVAAQGAASRDRGGRMRLELRYRSDIDLSQPAMQVEIRNHIARCLRDYPHGCEAVVILAGVEHCFMYVVNDDDVVDTVIGPPDYIEQVLNERQQSTDEARSRLPRNEHN